MPNFRPRTIDVYDADLPLVRTIVVPDYTW